MKAIILAAGEGTRLKPLTNTRPKPLIEIMGKSILEYNLECVYKDVDEIFIVVKYLKEKIIEKFGNNYKKVKITYIDQPKEDGTGASLWNIKTADDIIILYGDSILDENDIKKVIKCKNYAGLVKEVEEPKKYGIYKQDKKGFAISITEKPKKHIGNLANLGGYKFSKEIFEYVKKTKLSERGEYELTDALNLFLKNNKFELIKIKEEFIDIGYPWNILDANTYFLEQLKKSKIKGKIEDGVTIKGNIILEKGAILKSGTYIEGNVYIGKGSQIGPNAYLRGNTCIGEHCKIGNAVEIKNSSIGNHTNVAHLSYIGDSIIGNNTNIGGGFIGANARHDKANIKVMVKGKLVDTGKRKLGIIIGDNVKTGINSSSMPGRIIENDSFTMPGEIVK